MLVKDSLQDVMCSQNTGSKRGNKVAQKLQVEPPNSSRFTLKWSSAQNLCSQLLLLSHTLKLFNLQTPQEASRFFISLRLKRIYGFSEGKLSYNHLFYDFWKHANDDFSIRKKDQLF